MDAMSTWSTAELSSPLPKAIFDPELRLADMDRQRVDLHGIAAAVGIGDRDVAHLLATWHVGTRPAARMRMR